MVGICRDNNHLFICSEPLFSPEPNKMEPGNGYHQTPANKVACFPLQFGHELKIHSIDSDQKGEGHEKGRVDGKETHYFIAPLAGNRQIKVD
jgi:hypothetical protein